MTRQPNLPQVGPAPDLRVRFAIAFGAAVCAGALAAHTQVYGGDKEATTACYWTQPTLWRVASIRTAFASTGRFRHSLIDSSTRSPRSSWAPRSCGSQCSSPRFASLPARASRCCSPLRATALSGYRSSCRFPLSWLQRSRRRPLIMAFALLPPLAGFAFLKPNLATAFFARSPSISSLATCAVLLGLATLAFPHWPVHWFQIVRSSPVHTAPIRTAFGFVGVASILRWRRPEARLLFVMTVVPHGLAFYDELPLWLVALTRREAMLLTVASWLACFAGWGWATASSCTRERGRLPFCTSPQRSSCFGEPIEGVLPSGLSSECTCSLHGFEAMPA